MPPRPSKIISLLQDPLSRVRDIANNNASNQIKSNLQLAAAERDRIIRNPRTTESSVNTAKPTTADIGVYVKEAMGHMAERARENGRILEMIPQISQAANITISSVMSPNDLRPSGVTFSIECNLDEKIKSEVIKVIDNFFNNTLNLKERLPKWVEEFLYRSGAKSIAIIPISALDSHFNNPSNLITSQESFDASMEHQLSSGLGLFDTDRSIYTDTMSACETRIISDLKNSFMEADDLSTEQSQKCVTWIKEDTNKKVNKDELLKAIEQIIDGSIQVSDNPDIIKKGVIYDKRVKEQQKAGVKTKYKDGMFVSFDVPSKDDAMKDHPLFMELPTESVCPIFVPGSPDVHLGYFIALNEFGNPITIDPLEERHNFVQQNQNRNAFDLLFKSYGLTSMVADITSVRIRSMTKMYQTIIEEHLRTRLNKAGIKNADIGTMNGIYQYMLSRYLENRRTQLVYVPKEFMCYICKDYSEFGTGKSKLENIKFTLSIYNTMLIANAYTIMDNAVQREKITVTLPEEIRKNSGDMIALQQQIKRQYMMNRKLSFSMNPEIVSNSMAERSVSVALKAGQGLPEFDITTENVSRQNNEVNPEFLDRLKETIVIGLNVPPAALNTLSENEYSRSVATSNLYFANYIVQVQNSLCNDVADLARKYCRYSRPLYDKLIEIVKPKSVNKDEKKDKVNPIPEYTEPGVIEKTLDEKEVDLTDVSAEEIVANIINSITCTLPRPETAPNNSQLESAAPIIESIISVVSKMIPDELANGNEESLKALTILRGMITSNSVKEFLNKTGLITHIPIPSISDIKVMADTAETQLKLVNFSGLINSIMTISKARNGEAPPEGADASGGSSGGGFAF